MTKILNNVNIPDYICAFEKDKSIPTMAAKHVGKEIVLSIDLKDFFHTIKQSDLFDMFIGLGFGEKPARTLSEISTYKSFMPQGALTSPKLANMITALTFGPEVKQYCDSKNLTVTVYADDITMSTTDAALDTSAVLSEVIRIVRSNGFLVNFKKTKVMRKTQRQYVCGVVVNQKTNLIRKERNKLRAIVHNVTRNGLEVEATKNGMTPDKFSSHVTGRINWLKQLNQDLGQRMMSKLSTHLIEAKTKELARQLEESQKVKLQPDSATISATVVSSAPETPLELPF